MRRHSAAVVAIIAFVMFAAVACGQSDSSDPAPTTASILETSSTPAQSAPSTSTTSPDPTATNRPDPTATSSPDPTPTEAVGISVAATPTPALTNTPAPSATPVAPWTPSPDGPSVRVSPKVTNRGGLPIIMITEGVVADVRYEQVIRYPGGKEDRIEARYDETTMQIVAATGPFEGEPLSFWYVEANDPLGEYVIELWNLDTGELVAMATFNVE
jgi:hypothetical protein